MTAAPEAVCVFTLRWTTGLSARSCLRTWVITPPLCEHASMKAFAPGLESPLPLSPPPGCLRDVRLNGHPLPLDMEKPSKGLQVVSSQGVSMGCSSDACRKQHCAAPLVCVDLWRHQECRCSKQTQHPGKHLKSGRRAPTRSAHICTERFNKPLKPHILINITRIKASVI